jgi:iron complex outermembrane receptor protein
MQDKSYSKMKLSVRVLQYILLLILQTFSFTVFSQKTTGSLHGKVLTADGRPAPDITVQLKNAKRITITDNEGYFSFKKLPAVKDKLIISSVDSKEFSKDIEIEQGQSVDLGTVMLQYNITALQNVEINGRVIHSYKSDYSFFGTKTETPLKDIPQSISAITKEIIQDKMEFTLKEAVDAVAGVRQYSGYDEYTIRGFRAENARDINGLRGYNTTYTSSMLVNVERIEVIKGPTATLFGNCDPGGTINLVTKKPLAKSETAINIYGGSWDHFRAQGDATGAMNKSKTLLYRFNAGYDNTKSFRYNLFARSYQLAPSITFTPNDKLQVNVDFSVSHINTILDRGQPGFLNDATLKSTPVKLSISQPGDFLNQTDIASVFTASYKISKHLSFSGGYLNYITRQHVAEHGINSYVTPDSVNLYYTKWNYPTATNTISGYFTAAFNGGNVSHQLLAGYDFIRSTVNLAQQYYELPDQFGSRSGIVGTFSLNNPQYIQRPVKTYQLSGFDNGGSDVNDDVYHTQGVYMQDQLSWKKWKLLLSLREEFYKGVEGDSAGDLKENVFLPRIGIVYELFPNINVYATYNKGFDPFEASTGAQVFNAPFKPITSTLYEGGIKTNFFKNKLFATLAIYQLMLQNVAVNANDISNPNLFVQQGEDRSRGVETEAMGNVFPELSVMVSYAYSVAEVIQSKIPALIGTLLENAPRHSGSSWIKYTFGKTAIKGLSVSAGCSFASERHTLDPAVTLPGYFIVNGGIRYTYKHISVAANLNNITNKIYWTGAYNSVSKWPGSPRNCMVNLGYSF